MREIGSHDVEAILLLERKVAQVRGALRSVEGILVSLYGVLNAMLE